MQQLLGVFGSDQLRILQKRPQQNQCCRRQEFVSLVRCGHPRKSAPIRFGIASFQHGSRLFVQMHLLGHINGGRFAELVIKRRVRVHLHAAMPLNVDRVFLVHAPETILCTVLDTYRLAIIGRQGGVNFDGIRVARSAVQRVYDGIGAVAPCVKLRVRNGRIGQNSWMPRGLVPSAHSGARLASPAKTPTICHENYPRRLKSRPPVSPPLPVKPRKSPSRASFGLETPSNRRTGGNGDALEGVGRTKGERWHVFTYPLA
jgi:hypothetical protein